MPWMAAFCAGVIILYCSGRLLPWHNYIFVAFCALLVWFAGRHALACLHHSRLREKCAFVRPLTLIAFLGGLLWADDHVREQLSLRLPGHAFVAPVTVEGKWCSLPHAREFGLMIDFCADRLQGAQGLDVSDAVRRIRVSVPDEYQVQQPLQRTRLVLRLRLPTGRLNPGLPSFERLWFARGIVAFGRLSSPPVPISEPAFSSVSNLFSRIWLAWRWQLQADIQTRTADFEHGGILQALLLGDRSQISKADNELLRATGTQHLMAISGLHVGIITALLVWLLPSRPWALVVVALISITYVLLVGAPPSALRAWVMAIFALCIWRGYWALRPFQAWWLAMLVVLLCQPAAPLNMGFWYSFLAVACLLVFMHKRLNKGIWRQMLLLQCALFAFLQACNVWQGSAVQPVSILANLVAIPWVSLVVLPATIFSEVGNVLWSGMGQGLKGFSNEVLHVLMTFFAALQELNLPANSVPLKQGWVLAALLVLLLPLLRGLGALRALIAASLLVVLSWPFANGEYRPRVVFWDAGQGLAVGLSDGQQWWWYDLGARWERGSIVEEGLLPFTQQQGDKGNWRGLILSHGDNDHTGDAVRAIRHLQPDLFWAGEPERHDLGRVPTPCRPPLRWQSEHLTLSVLYAAPPELATDANARSCVVMADVAGLRVLLPGDLEGEAERHFLRTYQGDLAADVLVAGHHGSRHATSTALLKHVQPRFLVIPAPLSSRFGHPHVDVLARAQRLQVEILHLGRTGAVTMWPERKITSDAQPEQRSQLARELRLELERTQRKAFWFY